MSQSLVADIGGTNARFALVNEGVDLQHLRVLPCADYANVDAAIFAYLDQLGLSVAAIDAVALAIAGPVGGERIDMLNSRWKFSPKDLATQLKLPLSLTNDFTAQALCLDALAPEELCWLDNCRPGGGKIRAVIGPGTGLGVAALMPNDDVVPSEGGHVGFAPATAHQLALLQTLRERFERVSVERVVSGQGLENLYWANARLQGVTRELSAAQISAAATEGDSLALQAIADLFDILAGIAGDMALNFWAEDGVYLTGGVMQKLSEFFDPQRFREAFAAKGRLAGFCRDVPLAVITAQQPGLIGCAVALHQGTYRIT